MIMDTQNKISVLLYKDEGSIWHGQCLEHDISVQGRDEDEVINRMALTLNAEAQVSKQLKGDAFAGIDPAPAFFHKMWDNLEATKHNEPLNGFHAELRSQAA